MVIIMNLKKILEGLEGIKAKGEIDREITTIEKVRYFQIYIVSTYFYISIHFLI